MNDCWFEIACDAPSAVAELIADFLSERSANGVCLDNLQVDAFSTQEIPDSQRMTVRVYFETEAGAQDVLAELTAYIAELGQGGAVSGVSEPTLSTIRSEDWSSTWKEHFKPLRVGRHLLIVPTWEEAAVQEGDLVIRIDPGMAFGTGGHETTRLCLELLEKVIAAVGTHPSILDLGTGSGILAMAASLLGGGRILAVDIDPEAVEVARENLAINGLTQAVVCDTTPLESIDGRFDIILANILAEELVRLAPQLSVRIAPGGALILSGILAEKEQLVRDGFSKEPLEYCETAHAGEWVAMLYRNNG